MKYNLILLCLLFFACSQDNSPTNTEKEPPKSQLQSSKEKDMLLIPAGILHMGGDNKQASKDEFPKHEVAVDAFWMDETEVTNRQFEAFVKATGYITIAERPLDWAVLSKEVPPGTPKPPDSLLQPGSLVFQPTSQPIPLNDPSRWWHWTLNANWQHPEGKGSSIEDRMDHPVVQVAWEDAMAYAKWKGGRLPTEAEWEWASRGGLKDNIYPWGNEDVNEGKPKANFWQGIFPYKNENKDTYIRTAPVKSFPPNAYGLYDMAGNVWEWCSDWYKDDFYKDKTASSANTLGPVKGNNPYNPYQQVKTVRGGSFLCNDDYCSGYRNARRMHSSPDTGLSHTGFRCVKDTEK